MGVPQVELELLDSILRCGEVPLALCVDDGEIIQLRCELRIRAGSISAVLQFTHELLADAFRLTQLLLEASDLFRALL